MIDFGKLLVVAGISLIVVGLLLWSGAGRNWLGRLPGDLHYSRNNFSVHFPIVTCIFVSVLLTLLFRLFKR